MIEIIYPLILPFYLSNVIMAFNKSALLSVSIVVLSEKSYMLVVLLNIGKSLEVALTFQRITYILLHLFTKSQCDGVFISVRVWLIVAVLYFGRMSITD